jgi:hypothetical protein
LGSTQGKEGTMEVKDMPLQADQQKTQEINQDILRNLFKMDGESCLKALTEAGLIDWVRDSSRSEERQTFSGKLLITIQAQQNEQGKYSDPATVTLGVPGHAQVNADILNPQFTEYISSHSTNSGC